MTPVHLIMGDTKLAVNLLGLCFGVMKVKCTTKREFMILRGVGTVLSC